MTSSQTVTVFGVYLVGAALTLIFAPGVMFALLFAPPPTDPYYILLGIVVLVIGYYYIRLGRAGSHAFAQASVVGRLGFGACVGAAVVLGALPTGILIVAVADLLGALWTGRTLRREGFAPITM